MPGNILQARINVPAENAQAAEIEAIARAESSRVVAAMRKIIVEVVGDEINVAGHFAIQL